MAGARTGSVFKDQGKLAFDYLPDNMPHREAQRERLAALFRPLKESGAPASAFLHGPVGTGKTHLSRRFATDFAKGVQGSGRAIEHVVVNCRQRMGDDAVLLGILRKFDSRFPDRGFSISEKLQTLRGQLEQKKTHLIVILDEADALLKKSGSELVYTFTRWREEGGTTTVSPILISQKADALDLLDAAARSTFGRTNLVEFPRYSRDELRDISVVRAEIAFHPGTVPEDVLDLVADVAAEHGDARYAIELLWNAGLLADEENAEELAAEHVRGAKASIHPTRVEDRLQDLDVTRKLVLLAIARKARRKTFVTTGEAEEAYALVCEEFGQTARGHTQFWKYLKELDALGLIDAKISGEGIVGKTTMISLPELPAKVLVQRIESSIPSRKSRKK